MDTNGQQLLLDVTQAAARLGVSRSFLAKARVGGSGPRFVKVGRRVLYRVTDLEEFVERRIRNSTSDSEVGHRKIVPL